MPPTLRSLAPPLRCCLLFSSFETSPVKISIRNIRVVQQCGGLDPAESSLSPLSSDAAAHQNEKAWLWSTRLERESLSLSLERIQLKRPTVCCCPHRENYAIGCGAPVIVVYGRATRESQWQCGHWSLEGLCLGVSSTELNRESIFFFLSVWVCPPGPARPQTAWGNVSCCPDESKAFCGWAHSSSPVGLQLWRLPSLPLFRKRGALTLSAAAGTFENNCLYDCYFSYLFEEV